MRFSIRLIMLATVVFFVAMTTVAWAGPVTSKLTPEELAAVKAGKVIVKNDIKENSESGVGVAYGVIRGTIDDFWKVIFDHENYTDFYPRLEGIKVVERNKYSLATIEFKMDATIKTLTYTTIGTVTADKTRMDWKLDMNRPHKFFKKNGGYWQLEEIEPGVLLAEYQVEVALDLGPFSRVATKIVNSMAKDDLPEVIECTKNRVESGGTWVRPGKK
ncbi:MAG: SRPBCC family protein [Candidatus Lernaella stagnicola]|nr:SRPBCC family protein [Candidatus Lernaella stagnicola]